MQSIFSVDEMAEYSRRQRSQGYGIALVPTMGYLHEGHLSLVRLAHKLAERVVVSIFVNPTQFGPGEDFDRYPRDLDRDLGLLRKEKTDCLFHPSIEEMYPEGHATEARVTGPLTEVLCGAARPGHFAGVTTVVLKLFNIVRPDTAVFGQKDYQQCQVVKRMVQDLHLDVKIFPAPIAREADGLAMSSRNRYLSPDLRRQARELYASLQLVEKQFDEGERDAMKLREAGVNYLRQLAPDCMLDYYEIADRETLRPLARVGVDGAVALVAAYFGETRLIDNVLLT
ncbi:MAG TPA: pantoate--beta-alanine ligase [bacterium]|nr:pantoate--beta-alanine ligase [bacterium]